MKTLSLFLLVVLAVVAVLVMKPAQNRIPFSGSVWQEAAADRDSKVRLEMVDDLISKGLMHGKSKAGIVELLGEPSKVNYFKNAGYDLMYRLGGSGGLIPGPSYLAIAMEGDHFNSAAVLKD